MSEIDWSAAPKRMLVKDAEIEAFENVAGRESLKRATDTVKELQDWMTELGVPTVIDDVQLTVHGRMLLLKRVMEPHLEFAREGIARQLAGAKLP